MIDTIAPPRPRLGRPDVNVHLDDVLGQVGWLTTEQLGRRLEADGIVGWKDSVRWHPVGLWVVGVLQARGVDATGYSWVASLLIFGPGRVVIGEAKVAESHTLYGLECEINDGGWSGLVRQGEGDER